MQGLTCMRCLPVMSARCFGVVSNFVSSTCSFDHDDSITRIPCAPILLQLWHQSWSVIQSSRHLTVVASATRESGAPFFAPTSLQTDRLGPHSKYAHDVPKSSKVVYPIHDPRRNMVLLVGHIVDAVGDCVRDPLFRAAIYSYSARWDCSIKSMTQHELKKRPYLTTVTVEILKIA